MNPILSVVIVAYKSKEYISECLRSVYEAARGFSAEVIVVDNTPVKGLADYVHSEFPQVSVIENKMNTGFARGSNQGVRMASGRYLCLLNPDTRLHPGSLETLIGFLKQHPEDCVAGPRTIDVRGETVPSCRSLPHIVNALKYPISFLMQGRKLRKPRKYLLDIWAQNQSVDLSPYGGYVTGACLVTPLAFFRRMGMLDEQYFLYAEDADFGFRIAREGHPAYLVSEALVVHSTGLSAEKNPLSRIHAVESYLLYAGKNLSFLHRTVFRLCFLFFILTCGVQSFLKREKNSAPVLSESLKRFVSTRR